MYVVLDSSIESKQEPGSEYQTQLAVLVVPKNIPHVVLDDPDDVQILAAAVAGQAEYTVSDDHHLLDLREYQGMRILSPAAFLALLDAEEDHRS